MTKVMIFGTFDHLHDGHRFLVSQARARGAVVVVVATDPNVQRIKGHSSLQSSDQRMTVLQSEFPDLKVIAGALGDFLAPIRTEKPDLLLFGYDQKLPPGVVFEDLQCPWERAGALKPEVYKSSLLSPRKEGGP